VSPAVFITLPLVNITDVVAVAAFGVLMRNRWVLSGHFQEVGWEGNLLPTMALYRLSHLKPSLCSKYYLPDFMMRKNIPRKAPNYSFEIPCKSQSLLCSSSFRRVLLLITE
jgi:hypothetical protein